MWTHCMFCHHDLGRNEVVETFPIGRRLAFDESKGRLWAVCRKCERWNLSPLEERWEAIEACEREFRETRTRVSTEHIGLARLREGLELVRVGAPQRPEFAAWRYGDQFGRRRKKALLVGGAAVGTVGIAAFAGIATGAVSGIVAVQFGNVYNAWAQNRVVAKVNTPDGRLLKVKQMQLDRAQLLRPPEEDDSGRGGRHWALGIEHRGGHDVFRGDDAFVMAGRLMARVNRRGGKRSTVRDAVSHIEEARHPEAFLHRVIDDHAAVDAPPRYPPIDWLGRTIPPEKRKIPKGLVPPGAIRKLDEPTRLALEMALHEEQERRALEGELVLLEAAWRQAEEVAAIADDLLLPEGADEFIQEHRDPQG